LFSRQFADFRWLQHCAAYPVCVGRPQSRRRAKAQANFQISAPRVAACFNDDQRNFLTASTSSAIDADTPIAALRTAARFKEVRDFKRIRLCSDLPMRSLQ